MIQISEQFYWLNQSLIFKFNYEPLWKQDWMGKKVKIIINAFVFPPSLEVHVDLYNTNKSDNWIFNFPEDETGARNVKGYLMSISVFAPYS